MDINIIKKEMILEATTKYPDIEPITNYENDFTQEDNILIFWFNISSKTSHVVMREIN